MLHKVLSETLKMHACLPCLLSSLAQQYIYDGSHENILCHYNVLQCFPTSLSCLERASWAITQSLNFKALGFQREVLSSKSG